MRKFEAVMFSAIGILDLIGYFVSGEVTKLILAAGFILIGISVFFSIAEPVRFTDKISVAGLFRVVDKAWVIAAAMLGWLLLATGFSIEIFGP